jgi:formate dehydrogenase major subunit
MTLHFPDQVETNVLTLDTWDPKSGTAEFKATAIRVEHASAEEIAAATERLRAAMEVT